MQIREASAEWPPIGGGNHDRCKRKREKISADIRENERYIQERCENCADILIRPMRLGEERKADCLMVYIEVAVSNMMLDDSAIGKMINYFWEVPPEKSRNLCRITVSELPMYRN